MEAVHRVKLLLLLADFKSVKSAVPEIVERYQVTNPIKSCDASCVLRVLLCTPSNPPYQACSIPECAL